MVAAVFGCIFALLGIFTIGAIFVPLAMLCTVLALLVGVLTLRLSTIAMALVSGATTAAAFAVSPSAWILFAALGAAGTH